MKMGTKEIELETGMSAPYWTFTGRTEWKNACRFWGWTYLLKIHMVICSKIIANLMECVYTKGSEGGGSYAEH